MTKWASGLVLTCKLNMFRPKPLGTPNCGSSSLTLRLQALDQGTMLPTNLQGEQLGLEGLRTYSKHIRCYPPSSNQNLHLTCCLCFKKAFWSRSGSMVVYAHRENSRPPWRGRPGGRSGAPGAGAGPWGSWAPETEILQPPESHSISFAFVCFFMFWKVHHSCEERNDKDDQMNAVFPCKSEQIAIVHEKSDLWTCFHVPKQPLRHLLERMTQEDGSVHSELPATIPQSCVRRHVNSL